MGARAARQSDPNRHAPLILLALAFLAYGLFAFQQGFHWDDWGFAWMPLSFGLPGLVRYYSYDRPLLAYFVSLTSWLIGPHPLGWQFFGLLARAAAAIALWWVLCLAQPNRPRLAFWTSVFFLLYPGFRQQPIANAYGHYLFVAAAFFLSLGWMLKAMENSPKRWLLLSLALIFSLPNFFLTEYFTGLEVLRPILLWEAMEKQGWRGRRRALRWLGYYLPFVLVIGLFAYWRFFVAPPLRYGIELQPGEVISGGNLLPVMVDQWLTVSLRAWGQVFRLPEAETFGVRLMILYAALLLAVLEGLAGYSRALARLEALEGSRRGLLMRWGGLGAVAVLGAQAPFLLGRLTVKLQFPYDRFTLPFSLGIALLLVVLLELVPGSTRRSLVAASLAALALGLQIQTAHAFRADWNRVRQYLWQLSWRAPALQPGTALLSSKMPFQFSSDSSLTAPINWMYTGGARLEALPYLNWDLDVRTKSGQLTLAAGRPISSNFRVARFEGSTDHVLVLAFQPPGCVRVLNPRYDRLLWVAARSVTEADKVRVPFLILPYLTAQAMPLSNMQQIDPQPVEAVRPMDFLYPEPPHTWCYYFEKADLARQRGDWEEVARLGDRAFSIPYYPDDATEYLPFIEAYARLGRWDEARALSTRIAASMPLLRPVLCSFWQGLSRDPTLTPSLVAGPMQELQCLP